LESNVPSWLILEMEDEILPKKILFS